MVAFILFLFFVIKHRFIMTYFIIMISAMLPSVAPDTPVFICLFVWYF